MTTNSALRQSGRRELDQPSLPVRLEQRPCSASHDTKVRQAPGLHLFVRVRFEPAIYDGAIADEKFSADRADLADAARVNGSPVIPTEVGLGSAGGDREPTIERPTTAPSVGLVVAAAFVSVVDEAHRFEGAHQLESYLGLVPREASTGGKRKLGSITKQGNSYMRQLLVQSASGILRVGDPDDPLRQWGLELVARRGRKIAVVALARRLAGILWAMWRKGTVYERKRLGARSPSEQDATAAAMALKKAVKKARTRSLDTARALRTATAANRKEADA